MVELVATLELGAARVSVRHRVIQVEVVEYLMNDERCGVVARREVYTLARGRGT